MTVTLRMLLNYTQRSEQSDLTMAERNYARKSELLHQLLFQLKTWPETPIPVTFLTAGFHHLGKVSNLVLNLWATTLHQTARRREWNCSFSSVQQNHERSKKKGRAKSGNLLEVYITGSTTSGRFDGFWWKLTTILGQEKELYFLLFCNNEN